MLIATDGYGGPGLKTASDRVRDLCAELDDPRLSYRALNLLYAYVLGRGDMERTLETVTEQENLADQIGHPTMIMWSRTNAAAVLLYRGELDVALSRID